MLNMILFSILFTHILIGGLSVTVWRFLVIYSKQSLISDTEYDSSSNLDVSFHVRAEILYLLFFYDFYIFSCIVYAKVW